MVCYYLDQWMDKGILRDQNSNKLLEKHQVTLIGTNGLTQEEEVSKCKQLKISNIFIGFQS